MILRSLVSLPPTSSQRPKIQRSNLSVRAKSRQLQTTCPRCLFRPTGASDRSGRRLARHAIQARFQLKKVSQRRAKVPLAPAGGVVLRRRSSRSRRMLIFRYPISQSHRSNLTRPKGLRINARPTPGHRTKKLKSKPRRNRKVRQRMKASRGAEEPSRPHRTPRRAALSVKGLRAISIGKRSSIARLLRRLRGARRTNLPSQSPEPTASWILTTR